MSNLSVIFQKIIDIWKSYRDNKTSGSVPDLITGVNYHIGDLAIKYETGGRGPGYISNGSQWGDPGGDSYGSYQLESRLGTLEAYLKTTDKYTTQLRPFSINSADFKAKWKEIALSDPEGFQESQFMYLYNKSNGCKDAIDYARKLGWLVDNFALQSAIFSTSNQSGGWKIIFNNAKISTNSDVTTQINALYDSRAAYFQSLTSLSAEIKNIIIKARTVDERKDCLKLISANTSEFNGLSKWFGS